MSRNGSTWPGTLPTLRGIHPSFGRFKRFLRRTERRPAHSPPSLATPEGDRNLSRRPSSVFSRREVTNYGGPSTDTNDLGFGYFYDINKSLPFLDVATANADMAVSADECNPHENYASTSSAPPPLSALSGGFFAGSDLKDLPSSTSVRLSEMDVTLQHSFLGAGALVFAPNPTASTSQAGPLAHPFLSDLQPPNPAGLQFVCYSKEIVPQPSGPRMNCVPLPPLSPSLELSSAPFAHADESTNEQYNYETLYEMPFVANHEEPTTEQRQDTTPRSSASSYHTAPESLSPQREHQSEMVPETLVIAQKISSDHFKPRKLVIDWTISLIDLQSILSALRHCLQDLTIGPIGVGQPTSPSATATIDLPHLTSLKVDRVDFSFLKELLAFVRMDSLKTLDLLVGSLEVTPHELNLGWSRLTDVVLHDDFSPETLDNLMRSLRDVTQLKWLGNLLAKANGNQDRHQLNFLKDVSVCSNENGCSFFIRSLKSASVETLHLLHLPRNFKGHGFSAVENLSIENEISADQFLTTLHHFPTLVNADIKIGDFTATEQSTWFTIQKMNASLVSLTLRGVSVPIRPLLMPIPLSKLTSLAIMFDLKEPNHQFCLGLSDYLQKEKIQLSNLCLVDANMTVEESRSILEIVGPTLVDYQVRQTRHN